MKKHFRSLFDTLNRKWTISFFIIALILITSGNLVGTADNLPGISMVFFGMVFLFFSLLHSWQKPATFLVFSGICFGAIVLIVIMIYVYAAIFKVSATTAAPGKGDGIIETIALLTTIFICGPGIVTGLLGAFIRSVKKYSGIR